MGKMNPKYEPLFTPWKIGNVEIKNRIVLCPMGGTSLFGWMEPNHFDKEAAKFLFGAGEEQCGADHSGDRADQRHDRRKMALAEQEDVSGTERIYGRDPQDRSEIVRADHCGDGTILGDHRFTCGNT